ncbi:MAG: amino acid ABC transporter substrate-binding protein [Azoarcus sp.]|nr:amino acid ABC transporter substrate-binding protein [Azoarcus sp.]
MSTRKNAALLAASLAIALSALETAHAEDAAPTRASAPEAPLTTLEKARKNGTIVIGHRTASVPFSYLDSSRQPTGYAKELCDRIVKAIRREFNMPQLKIIYRAVTARERLPMLRNGMIDLECGSSTITAERQKHADFSIVYFISSVRLLTRRAYDIRGLDDLADKTIVFTTGTTAESVIQEKLDIERHRIAVVEGKTHAASFLMVRTGRAAAYMTNEDLLAGLIANARDPNAYEIVGPPLSVEHYAIMMRKGDVQLKNSVDKALVDIIVSGEMKELYDRWFTHPLPPSGANLNLPMSAELEQLFARQANAANTRPPAAQGARRQ